MTCMLHTLSSTFTTCACGSKSKECVLRLMEAFVDCEPPPKPPNTHIDMGPLVGHRRGFRTREKVLFSGGLTGVEMVTLEPMSRATSSSSTDSEPHGRLLDGDMKLPPPATPTFKPSSLPSTSRKRRRDGTLRDGRGSSSSDSEVDHSGGFCRFRLGEFNSHLVCSYPSSEAETKDRPESVRPRPSTSCQSADCASQDAQAMDPSDNARIDPKANPRRRNQWNRGRTYGH
jgi:hypothetical protein